MDYQVPYLPGTRLRALDAKSDDVFEEVVVVGYTANADNDSDGSGLVIVAQNRDNPDWGLYALGHGLGAYFPDADSAAPASWLIEESFPPEEEWPGEASHHLEQCGSICRVQRLSSAPDEPPDFEGVYVGLFSEGGYYYHLVRSDDSMGDTLGVYRADQYLVECTVEYGHRFTLGEDGLYGLASPASPEELDTTL